MKCLTVAICLVVAVSAAQADSFGCRRVGYCSTPDRVWGGAVSGHRAHVADDMFGLRITDAGELQSPAEGRNVDAHNTARRPGAADYVAEAGGALVGGTLVSAGAGLGLGLVGAALGYLLFPGYYDPGEGPAALGFAGGAAIGIVLGYPAGCAMGTATAGKWMKREGNTRRAYAGAYLGLPAAIPAAAVTYYVTDAVVRWVGGPDAIYSDVPLTAAACLAALTPPICAVIGYNTGVQRTSSRSSLGARLAPPALAYRSRLGQDRQRYSAFDCRLVTVRF